MGWAVSTELVDIALIVCYNFFDELQLSLFYIIIAIFEIGGLVMKTKQFLITACMLLLLCACQSPANTEDTANDLPPENVEIETPASDSPTEEEPAALLPPAPPACEIAFTETESFPLPFEEELLVDEEEGILLSAGQALYDYDTMWELLEENYPYFDVIKEELGISSRVVKTQYRAKLVSLADDGYIAQREFTNIIDSCMKEFLTVGHLYVISPAFRQTILDSCQDSDRSIDQTIFELANCGKVKTYYTCLEGIVEEVSESSITDTAWQGPYSHMKTAKSITRLIAPDIRAGYVDDIPYLSIPTFSGWTEDTYTGLSAFLCENSGRDHLIIDIRGNTGGSELSWSQGIVTPLISEDQTWNMLVGVKTGTLNLAMIPFLDHPNDMFDVYQDDSWKIDFPLIADNHFHHVDLLLKATKTIHASDSICASFKKIWVLIDEKCYSAADSFAYFCKKTGFATLVGTTTGGNGIGGQPTVMALPYSGLLILYDPYLSFNPDGTCNGISGTTPDVVPMPGQMTLETCMQAILKE